MGHNERDGTSEGMHPSEVFLLHKEDIDRFWQSLVPHGWKLLLVGVRQLRSRYEERIYARDNHLMITITRQNQTNVARFLLRDGNKVGAEVSPAGLEAFTYEDQKGQLIHALATVKADREFLRQVPSKLLPLNVRMETGLTSKSWRESVRS